MHLPIDAAVTAWGSARPSVAAQLARHRIGKGRLLRPLIGLLQQCHHDAGCLQHRRHLIGFHYQPSHVLAAVGSLPARLHSQLGERLHLCQHSDDQHRQRAMQLDLL